MIGLFLVICLLVSPVSLYKVARGFKKESFTNQLLSLWFLSYPVVFLATLLNRPVSTPVEIYISIGLPCWLLCSLVLSSAKGV